MTNESKCTMSYGTAKKIIVFFLVTYFAVGMLARYFRQGPEDFYPFFSWFLFAEVPQITQEELDIHIREIKGE